MSSFVKKGGRVANADENGCKADFEPILNGWFSKFKQACGFYVARLRGEIAAIVEHKANWARRYA